MANKPHEESDFSEADIQRLVEMDRTDQFDNVADGDSTVEITNASLKKAQRSLDFLNHVRKTNPNVVDDLVIETNMPTWFEMDGGHPSRIGRHEIIERLGSGGFGVVFLARDPELERLVALKVPRVETLIHTQTRRRFIRESKTAAQLDHPNIATVYEAGSVGPVFYIASQYCPGGSLENFIEGCGGKLPPPVASEVIATLAEAVDHAHSRGILHRDIKPSNILLDVPPEQVEELTKNPKGLGTVCRLVDFGLAKHLDASDEQTRTGVMLGTPAYTAPELVMERPDIGPRIDVYSLGTTLYRLLTGSPPHKKETKFETLMAAQKLDATPPSRQVSGVTRDLDAICLKAIERRPQHRYASAKEFAIDLRNHLAGKPVRARQATRVEKVLRWSGENAVIASLAASSMILAIVATSAILYAGAAYQSNLTISRQLNDQRELLSVQRIFDQTRRAVGAPTRPAQGIHADLSPDGSLAMLTKDDTIQLWDLRRGRPLADIPCHNNQTAFVGDGTGIVFWSLGQQLKLTKLTTIVGVDLVKKTLSPPITLDIGPFATQDLKIQSNGGFIAYRVTPEMVRIINTVNSQVFERSFDSEITSLALSHDGRLIAVARATENQVDIVNTLSDQVTAVISTRDPSFVTYSPDGEWLAISNGRRCELRRRPDWQSGKQLGISQHLANIAFSSDSRFVAVVSGKNEITLFSIARNEAMNVLNIGDDETIAGLQFSDNGRKMLATSELGQLNYWDLFRIDELLVDNPFHAPLVPENQRDSVELPIVFSADWITVGAAP